MKSLSQSIVLVTLIKNFIVLAYYVDGGQLHNVRNGTLSFDFNRFDSTMLVSSYLFNPSTKKSPWIEHFFGRHAIHFGIYENLQYQTLDQIMKRTKTVLNIPPQYLFNNTCSIELLGHIRQDSAIKLYGNAILLLRDVVTTTVLPVIVRTQCFYRAFYDRWGSNSKIEKEKAMFPYYYTLFIYCPTQNEKFCDSFNAKFNQNLTQSVAGELIIQTAKSRRNFSASFRTNSQFHRTNNVPFNNYETSIKKDRKVNKAVCLVLPYVSSNEAKKKLNSAILSEWVHYYSQLGYKVLVYDRDSAHYDDIYYSNIYKTSQNLLDINTLKNVYYFPYTIWSLLQKGLNRIRYDNTDPDLVVIRNRRNFLDADKTNTITHCRFEAYALFGIDNVFVADSDEFIYCPYATHTPNAQTKAIDNVLVKHSILGLDSLFFIQLTLSNRTDDPIACMNDKIDNGISFFDCFGSLNQFVTIIFPKSFHLTYACPYTDVHVSCSFPDTYDHECLCNVTDFHPNDEPLQGKTLAQKKLCGIAHLNLNPRDLHGIDFWNKDSNHLSTFNTVRNSLSEFSLMARQRTNILT